jgi:hypothetical protein
MSKPTKNSFEAFRMGWKVGRSEGERTPRQAERILLMARWELLNLQGSVDSFCQGSIDGAGGDRWRLDRMEGR